MAKKAPDIFVRLDAKFDDDEAMWEISPYAELLFIRSLAYAKRKQTDGAIPSRALNRLCIRISADAPGLASELVMAGLWDLDTDDGWTISGWSRWQMTTEEQKDERDAKRRGGLVRAHRSGNHSKDTHPECPECATSSPAETCSSPAGAEHVQSIRRAPALPSLGNVDVDVTTDPDVDVTTDPDQYTTNAQGSIQEEPDEAEMAVAGIQNRQPQVDRVAIIGRCRDLVNHGAQWPEIVAHVLGKWPSTVGNPTGLAVAKLTELQAATKGHTAR